MLDAKGLEAAARKLRNAEKEKFGSWPDADDSKSIAAAAIAAYLSSVQAEPAVAGVETCKFYHSQWPVEDRLKARGPYGLITDDGEAWRYEYTHSDADGGPYDVVCRPRSALVASPPAEPVVEADAEPANCISLDTKDCLVGSLRTAIDHIEHMSEFLSKLQVGYSFEGIGEDMPNLRDALASATSSDVTKYPTGVSSRDHIAHDMKIGRFPRQSSIDTFLRERALATKPAVKDDETVVALPPTREYVDRIVRIFRDRPADDTSAFVLQDYARAALAAKEGRHNG